MKELVIRNYWWLGIIKDVGKYMEGCDLCQRMKNRDISREVDEK